MSDRLTDVGSARLAVGATALLLAVSAVGVLVLLLTLLPGGLPPGGPVADGGDRPGSSAPASPPAPTAAPVRMPAGLPDTAAVSCPDGARDPGRDVEVTDAEELQEALDEAGPGDLVTLADGVYEGEFTASADGTETDPVWVCGRAGAVLQGPGTDDGFVLHLQGVAHWRLVGFTVREGQKGVMADGTTSSVLQDLTVTEIGDEAVHLRTGSTDNVVRGLTISDTGQRKERFGEGVYVGTAESNWCDLSDCEPDESDRNVITANTITDTTAEAVDIKEGTTGGVVHGNTFDGAGMADDTDSWVDLKGNGWLVQANRGTTSERSGFEVQEVVDGWGTDNTFDGNTADVRGPGYGIDVKDVDGNRVTCSNEAIDAEEGLSTIECT
ncbi:MAG: Endo-1,4-beta-glucanase Z [uncultured Quadrisphaera sp.]|uniref:Endo-1,4-beta-glucanase Z n=1 Tax=uncultured Quadrisphaera sp. TaxID=904978 RepID=A0A6J4QD12_9ACTN|nr:MAG: Endo-1,4-beta-glucanase Z [uncultured Quadrisphaera sp.]